MFAKISNRLAAFIGRFRVLRANIRFFANNNTLVSGIMGCVTTIIICSLLSVQVLPLLINGSDGGIGEATLPIAQAALLVGGIFGGIGILYVVAKSSFGGK